MLKGLIEKDRLSLRDNLCDQMPDMNRHLDSVGKGVADFLVPPPEGVIRFTVGQPDFVTPEGIREVAIQSLQDGETSYTRTGGSEELC